MAEQMDFIVTRGQLEDARKRLGEAGFNIIGDVGTVKEKGFVVSYSYNEPAARLTLVLEKKPMFIPVSVIKGKVRKALADEGIKEA